MQLAPSHPPATHIPQYMLRIYFNTFMKCCKMQVSRPFISGLQMFQPYEDLLYFQTHFTDAHLWSALFW